MLESIQWVIETITGKEPLGPLHEDSMYRADKSKSLHYFAWNKTLISITLVTPVFSQYSTQNHLVLFHTPRFVFLSKIWVPIQIEEEGIFEYNFWVSPSLTFCTSWDPRNKENGAVHYDMWELSRKYKSLVQTKDRICKIFWDCFKSFFLDRWVTPPCGRTSTDTLNSIVTK